MSEDTIYMNYVSTLDKASVLDELAQSMRKIAVEVEESTAACACRDWEGSTRDAFLTKNRRLASNFRAHAWRLERCAELLRISAYEHYKNEMLAQTLFGG